MSGPHVPGGFVGSGPLSATSQATGSTIDEQMANHIRTELAKPSDNVNAETPQTRQNWRHLLTRHDQKQQASKARNGISRGAATAGHDNGGGGWGNHDERDNIIPSAPASTGLSARRFDGSILDMGGLSNLDLHTADHATRRRVIDTCNQNAEYFRAELDRRRSQQRRQEDQSQPQPQPQQQRPPTASGVNQQAAMTGSKFASVSEIDDKMEELLCAQEKALQEALRHEMEIKRLWWLRQQARKGG
ncbi:hypothetical protein LZ32DRAFT_639360 [Colletotrichum eremochloae]|nr:hypothetical protein LZ32DRAFT_639360 [Colletotrichum eremochloae]